MPINDVGEPIARTDDVTGGLMARLAAMVLREGSSTWHREPFTSESRSHISVGEKAS